jgi:acid phosphatase (class A)
MRQRVAIAFAVVLLAVCHAQAQKPTDEVYLATEELDTTFFMAPTPSAEASRKEVQIVVDLQAKRTEQQLARCMADIKQSVFRFADVVGENFTTEKLPKATVFFHRVYRTESGFNKQGKTKWERPRPPAFDERVKPIEKLDNAAYPSGHSAFAYLTAIVLADIVPEKRDAIFARAIEFGNCRVLGGMHFPTDVEAGRQMAAMVAVLMYKNPAFQKDLEDARAEVRPVLGLSR